MPAFSECLIAARERAGLTREQVAVALTRSAGTIAAYERGVITPPRAVVVRLANLLEEPSLLKAGTLP